MQKLIRTIEQFWCKHPTAEQMRRAGGGRLWLECRLCGHCSHGIEQGAKIAAVILLILMMLPSCMAQDAPKPQPFFSNTTNRALVGAELTTRVLDAVSTEQFIHNPCHCMEEKGHFLWASMKPIADRPWAMYSYSLAFAGGVSVVSRSMWRASQRRHSKYLRVASRLVLVTDIVLDGSAFVNNRRLIARLGE